MYSSSYYRHTHTHTEMHVLSGIALSSWHTHLRTARSVAHKRPFLVWVHHSGQLLIKLQKKPNKQTKKQKVKRGSEWLEFPHQHPRGKIHSLFPPWPKLPLHLKQLHGYYCQFQFSHTTVFWDSLKRHKFCVFSDTGFRRFSKKNKQTLLSCTSKAFKHSNILK